MLLSGLRVNDEKSQGSNIAEIFENFNQLSFSLSGRFDYEVYTSIYLLLLEMSLYVTLGKSLCNDDRK